MSSTNDNDGTLIPNEGTNTGSENNDSNTGSENSGENNNESGEGVATSPGDDNKTDGKGGMSAENSGGTPHKGNRPKPDAGVGVYGLR